jgi:hypothetical protein
LFNDALSAASIKKDMMVKNEELEAVVMLGKVVPVL